MARLAPVRLLGIHTNLPAQPGLLDDGIDRYRVDTRLGWRHAFVDANERTPPILAEG
jgi:hypothetical protein